MPNTSISYVKGDQSRPLLNQTIGENLYEIAQLFPHNEALVCMHQGYRATYQQLYQEVEQVAKSLIAIGVVKGDRVGVWSHNRYEWVLLQYATALIGAILVNINPAYKSSELLFALNQSGVKFLFSALSFKTTDYKQLISDIANENQSLHQVIYFDQDWDEFLSKNILTSQAILEDFKRAVYMHDAVNIQYTSGTTGTPKGVTLTHYNVLNNGFFIGERLQYTSEDRVCIPVPFYHCFGMVIGNLCCTSKGATMVIPNDVFDPRKTLHAVEAERCTSLYGVPTMFISMLELLEMHSYDVHSLRTGVMAGSPCPIEIMKQVKDKLHMPEISVCYGMTETSPVSVQTKIGTPIAMQVSTVGTVMDHLEIKIVNPETQETVPLGEKGELCTRGYSVMQGYWENSEATQKVIDDEGWMHSGDEGKIDAEGYITITGRIKDLIIRGGENISPKEIEDFLFQYPKVKDVQVVGVSDEKYGEVVMAWIIPHENTILEKSELIEFSKGKIAHFKIPQYWHFVSKFPTTVTGKVQKNVIRDLSEKLINK